MKRADNNDEHAHDRFVAVEVIREGELDFGLNFVRLDRISEEEFKNQIVKRDK